MRTCPNCNQELMDDATVCPSCGQASENNTEPKKAKKKGKKTALGITFSVLLIIIARVIGGFIGETTAKNIAENNEKNKIDKFIESMDEYTPGHCDGNEYVSEAFGFKFVIDENWEFYSDADLKKATKTISTSAETAALAALEKEDISEDLKEKYAESFYAKVEMGALYVADAVYVGEVSVSVMSAYGIDDTSIDEYVDGIKSGLDENAQVSEENIAGNTYKTLSAEKTDSSGNKMTVKMYITIKDSMCCMITCKALLGYEEQVFSAFESRISAYN